jgi:MFS family permease
VAAVMPSYWLFAASTVLIGFSVVTMLTTANGYVQTTTDPLLRGRVMALYMAILSGGTPIGAPIVGAVANAWGPRWALGVAAVAAAVAALVGLGWLIVGRGLRVVRHPAGGWMPRFGVDYTAAPTAAIAVPVTRPVDVIDRTAPIDVARRTAPVTVAKDRPAGATRPAPRSTARATSGT